jgi:F-type H+-transporting ATPase subunit epsilon
MAVNDITVTITTPQIEWSFENVSSCSAPGVEGGFQILSNHASLLSQLEIGLIKLKTTDGEEHLFATSGGFLEVHDNKVSIVVETCERASEIDVARAEHSAERARHRLKERPDDLDVTRAELSLQRALNRIRIAYKLEVTTQ